MGSRFLVFDLVRIAEHPNRVAAGASAQRLGFVTGIRSYDDGSFRYDVAATDDVDADDVAGIYDEETLIPTGEQVSLDRFDLPAGFRIRDIATVSAECSEPDVAGRTVEISAGHVDPGTGTAVLGVWCEELGEAMDLPAACLTRTGERMPPRARGQRVESTQVGPDGELHGTVGYVMVDEVDQYL